MGITIHYSGKLANLRALPELLITARYFCFQRGWEYSEVDERVIGEVERWTTTDVRNEELSDDETDWTDTTVETSIHPLDDVQRGIVIDPHPESEAVSLVFNQAGELCYYLPTVEKNQYWESKRLFTKTQFAPLETHIAICELLHLIQARHFPELRVNDEGEYFETGDRARLEARFGLLDALMNRVQAALSDEDSDDPLGEAIRGAAEQAEENAEKPRKKKKLNLERGKKIETADPIWHRARGDASAGKN